MWFEDLRYYRACGFFDGRRPPELDRLEPFRETETGLPGGVSLDATGV